MLLLVVLLLCLDLSYHPDHALHTMAGGRDGTARRCLLLGLVSVAIGSARVCLAAVG